MNNTPPVIREIIFRAGISVLWCIALGYLFWQSSVFNPYHTAFQYVEFGILGSLFFQTLRVRGIRDAIPVLIVVSMAIFIFVRHLRGIAFFANVSVMTLAAAAIYLFFAVFYHRDESRRFAEPLVLGVLCAIGAVISGLVFIFAAGMRVPVTLFWVYQITREWFLIGLGIGTGIILTEEPYAAKCKRLFEFSPRTFLDRKGPA